MTTITIDDATIAAYSAGIAETASRHLDPAHPAYSGAPLIVASAIIPGTGALLFTLGLGSKLSRIVHAGIDLRLVRPLVAGDSVTCTASHSSTEDKGSGELISMDYVLKDLDGAVVCDGQSRYFVRGDATRGSAHVPAGLGAGLVNRRGAKEEIADPGPPGHEVTETVATGLSLLYAEGSGDRFPIHTDANFARSVGLPDVILHGMCTLAIAIRAVVESVAEGDSARLQSVSVRFAKMVLHEDALTTRIWNGDQGRIVFETLNQRGEAVLIEGACTFGS